MRHRERVVRRRPAGPVVGVETASNNGKSTTHTKCRPSDTRRTPEVEPQLAEHRPHHRALARDEQQQVAGLRAERVDQTELLRLRQELGDRRLELAAVAARASTPGPPRPATWRDR